jgi:hypothetical protein
MPHAKIWERQGVVIHYWGTVSAADLVKSSQELAAEPAFDELKFIIIDFADVSDHGIDEAAIEQIAVIRIGSMMSNPNIRVLLVTTDHRMTALAGSMAAEPFTGTHAIKLFPTMAAAREWLSEQPVLTAFRRPT